MRQEDFKRRAVPVLYPVTPQSTDLEPPCRWAISLSTSHGLLLKFYGKPLIWLVKIFQDFKPPLIAPQSCHPDHSHRPGYKKIPNLHVFISLQDKSSSQPCSTCKHPKNFLILAAQVRETNCGSKVDIFLSCRRNF